MSAIEAEFEDLFAGRPDELAPHAQGLVNAAEAIATATEALRSLVDGQTSASTDALAETASEVARSLSSARLRYRNTGDALNTFAADLRPIQRDARNAVDAHNTYEQRTYTLPNDIARRENDLARAEILEVPRWEAEQIADDLWQMRQVNSTAEAGVADARNALYAARDRLRVIADEAIRAIEVAIERDHDTAADNWNQFWEGAAGWIGEWAANLLKGILEFLGQLLAVLVAIVVIILVIVVVVALLTLLPTSMLLIVGVVSVMVICTMVVTFRIRESRDPNSTGETEFDRHPADLDGATTDDEYDDAYTPSDYGDLFEDVGEQDAEGGTSATRIRVVAVTDADGNVVSYRVQLPSTQNWSPFNSDGALNDLSADAMLALFPGVQTQYEKAVWDAMERAGVFDSDAPIMLTGWSLGGMMAGDLATDPRLAGRVESVVTAGSAVDKHASEMDPSIRVTQVNNRWDPVHTLEFVGYDPDEDIPGENWQTYHPVDGRIHNADMYGELADDVIPTVRTGDEVFFADDVDGTYEHVYEMEYTRG